MNRSILTPPLALALLVATGTSCASRAGSALPFSTSGSIGVAAEFPQDTASRLNAVREGADAMLHEQGAHLWDTWSRGVAPDFHTSTAAHEVLFALTTLDFVKSARQHAEGDEQRALTLLHAFLVGERLAHDLAARPERAGAKLNWSGQAIPTWRAPALLANETDAARRLTLEHAWAEAERQRAAGLQDQLATMSASARAMGYDSLLALAAELRGASADSMATLAEQVLSATDTTYRALFEQIARAQLGVGLAQLHGRDLARLWRSSDELQGLPPGHAVTDVTQSLAALGFDLQRRAGVVLDLAPRAGKDPRALTVPVDVPSSVRVSFAPQGGATELRALLHEMGAATYFTRITSPVMEFRRLGAVTAETWASLFEELAGDPIWLAQQTSLTPARIATLVRSHTAQRLLRVRTAAARILIEIARHREPAGIQGAARRILERAYSRSVDEDEVSLFLLLDADPLLESADTLRAQLLAAQAEAFLSKRFGTPWWRARASGNYLQSAFGDGSRLAPEELSHLLGGGALAPSALANSLRARSIEAGLQVPAP